MRSVVGWWRSPRQLLSDFSVSWQFLPLRDPAGQETSYFQACIDSGLPGAENVYAVERVRSRRRLQARRGHQSAERTMPLAFVIEVNADVVGLAVRESDQYRLHAVARGLCHLEGELFASPLEAERMAWQQVVHQAHSVGTLRPH
jgi:hypothetical protein